MKLSTPRFGFFLKLLLLALCIMLLPGSAFAKKYTVFYSSQRYDTVVGKWQSNDGDTMEIKEDGNFWRNGKGYSEQGSYTVHPEQWLQIGSTYRPYPCIGFYQAFTTDNYFYHLKGNTLELCASVDPYDGSFPASRTIVYHREVDGRSYANAFKVNISSKKTKTPEAAIVKYHLRSLMLDAQQVVEVTQLCDTVTSAVMNSLDADAIYARMDDYVQEFIKTDYDGSIQKYLQATWSLEAKEEMEQAFVRLKNAGEKATPADKVRIEIVTAPSPVADPEARNHIYHWGSQDDALPWEDTAFVECNIINEQTGEASTEKNYLVKYKGNWYVFDATDYRFVG